MTHRTRAIVCLVLCALVAGCERGPKKSPEEKFRAYLEEGNAAYRDKNYKDALASYRKATQTKPEDGAGYFGIYMSYTAMGKKDEADAAYKKATELSPGLGGQPHPMSGEEPTGGMGAMGGAEMGMGGDATANNPHAGMTTNVPSDTAGGMKITSDWMKQHAESMKKSGSSSTTK